MCPGPMAVAYEDIREHTNGFRYGEAEVWASLCAGSAEVFMPQQGAARK